MILNLSGRAPVRSSDDLRRVLALPRRPPLDFASPRAEAVVEVETRRYRRPDRPPGAPCGCASFGRRACLSRLLPAQAWALREMRRVGGLVGMIAVGGGKTLLNILAALAVPDVRVAALLVPPGLVGQLRLEYLALREHFRVPSIVLPGASEGYVVPGAPVLHVVPYSRLQMPGSTTLLESLRPDLFIADECHALKNLTSARTIRFVRVFAEREGVRLCTWSGTAITRSVLNVSHLMAFALGERSPLPLDPGEASAWASHVDPSDWPAPAGALRALGEPVRDALRRRIAETEGVITAASGSAAVARVVLRESEPSPIPVPVAAALAELRSGWVRPDGEEFVDAFAAAACLRQLAHGFYYRWVFPDDPPRDLVDRWFAARKAWCRAVRERLTDPRPHADSPKLLEDAAQRAETGYVGDLPAWPCPAWPDWRDVRDLVRHDTEVVWIDRWLVDHAAAWARRELGVVWSEHDAFGEALAEALGVPYHAGGPGAEARILSERGERSVVASVDAHGQGRDGLQHLFSRQLVVAPMVDGGAWEQLLGRLNRRGQDAEEVVTEVCRHVPEFAEAVDRAVEIAKFVEGITTNYQMLLSADVEWLGVNHRRPKGPKKR